MDKTFPHIGRKVLALNGRRLEQALVATRPNSVSHGRGAGAGGARAGNGTTQVEGNP